MDVKTVLVMFLGLVIFGWLFYFCAKCYNLFRSKVLDNNEVKSLKNCETCVEPPSYDEVVIEDKMNLPTFEEIQHM